MADDNDKVLVIKKTNGGGQQALQAVSDFMKNFDTALTPGYNSGLTIADGKITVGEIKAGLGRAYNRYKDLVDGFLNGGELTVAEINALNNLYNGNKPFNVNGMPELDTNNPDQPTPKHYYTTGDFNEVSKNVNVDKYEGLTFQNGDYKMPKPLLDAAKTQAQQLIANAARDGVDLAQTEEWKGAAAINKDNKITVESLSAFLLARSMGDNTSSYQDNAFRKTATDTFTATFDNKMNIDDYRETKDVVNSKDKVDPKVIFEMARQIMGDNGMQGVVGGATNTAQADAQFVQNSVGHAATNSVAKC